MKLIRTRMLPIFPRDKPRKTSDMKSEQRECGENRESVLFVRINRGKEQDHQGLTFRQ